MEKYHIQKTFQVPIYVGQLIVCISNDLDKVAKINSALKKEVEIWGNSSCFNYKDKTTYMAVINLDHSYCTTPHSVISHESVHIADYIFEDVGAKHDVDNPEPYTYLMQWVVDRVYEVIEKAGMLNKLTTKKEIRNPIK